MKQLFNIVEMVNVVEQHAIEASEQLTGSDRHDADLDLAMIARIDEFDHNLDAGEWTRICNRYVSIPQNMIGILRSIVSAEGLSDRAIRRELYREWG